MTYTTHDLSQMFGKAAQTLDTNRQKINQLDGGNGNHGDNMVHNVNVIQQALQANSGQPPAQALRQAAQSLASQGRGSASTHYVAGLQQAATQIQGKQSLDNNDVASMVQTLLGSVPASQASVTSTPSNPPAHQPHVKPVLGADQPSGSSGDDLFGNISNLLGGSQPSTQPVSSPQPQAGGSILDLLGGLASGNNAPTQSSGGNSSGLGLGNLLNAGMAFVQAEQSGADTGQAALQALQAGLAGSNPLQSGSPRAASGGLIAQTILGMLSGK
jgi:DAK2 domain